MMVSRTRKRATALLVLGTLFLAAGWSGSRAGDEKPAGKGKHEAAEKKTSAPEKGHDTHGAKDEHKMTAAEEVGDRRGWVVKSKKQNADGSWEREWEPEPWYLFHEFHISLPVVGWFSIGDYAFPTKYMWLTLIAASLTYLVFTGLSQRVQDGSIPRGPFWNFFESLLTFIRNEVAKPNFPEHPPQGHGHEADHGHGPGHGQEAPHAGQLLAPEQLTDHPHDQTRRAHPADQFVPLLWTLFIFILFCNLLGMVPFMGSPTANIFMTGGLALCVFFIMHGAAVVKMGGWQYIKALWPKIDLPFYYGIGWLFGTIISLMIFVIELFSSIIKSGVLAIRLFANMFAGHMVLASILLFIVATRESSLWAVVTTASVLGVLALSLLELFVAFLQAYIFTFLTALFIGMAVHPQH
ncbi:MAG TPA: F0F1 ATP synthase subunit A [Gemmataceae bacterium]|nr:F0F1 ATP synthase subunit A [Gemmataceae bacterium]